MSIVDVMVAPAQPRSAAHRVGAPVAVRNRYLGTWSAGFEVVALHPQGCLIRRASDGSVIPEVIPFDDVREPYGPARI
jgi:hypothetical protein